MAELVTDGAAVEQLIHSPSGPVGRWLFERGTQFQAAARTQAPIDTGCLRATILKRWADDNGKLVLRVVSDTTPCSPTRTGYALYIHEGTEPHDIPNSFGWGKTFGIGGRFDGRFHPGNKANRYLTDNLSIFLV